MVLKRENVKLSATQPTGWPEGIGKQPEDLNRQSLHDDQFDRDFLSSKPQRPQSESERTILSSSPDTTAPVTRK